MPRITPEDAKGMMNAYAKVYAQKEEPKPEIQVTEETPKEEPQAEETK